MDLHSSIGSIFTPTLLFLLLNLVIAIALLSSRHRSGRDDAAAAAGGPHRPLARSSSSNVLESIRSLGLFRFRSDELPPIADHHDPPAPPEQQQPDPPIQHHQIRRIRSESDTKVEADSSSKMMKKSASSTTWRPEERAAPAVLRREASVDEEVDAKADDFINRFRQQLKLQRLDSLVRYKEILANQFK